MSRRKLHPGDEEAVAAAYQAGRTLEQLAAEYDCAVSTIARTLAREGVQPRPRRHDYKLSDRDAAVLASLWKSGVSIAVLTKAWGVSTQTLYRALERWARNQPKPRIEEVQL